jgi:hypothetical protein
MSVAIVKKQKRFFCLASVLGRKSIAVHGAAAMCASHLRHGRQLNVFMRSICQSPIKAGSHGDREGMRELAKDTLPWQSLMHPQERVQHHPCASTMPAN